MENTHVLGDLKSTHAPSKTFIYLTIFIFIIFSGISGLIYYGGILSVQQGKSNFSGDISVLYWAIAFIMGLAVFFLFLSIMLTKGKTYLIHEGGIISDDKGEKKTLLFKDMDDLYLFRSGKSFMTNNIAFRNRNDKQWEVITPRYSKEFKAIELITEQHQAINTPEILKKLASGQSVTFNYINYGTSVSKQLFATGTKSFLKVEPKDIVVYKDHMVIDSKQIMFSTLSRFSSNDWISKISIYDKDNNVVFSTSTNGIFSGYTFISLLDHLINNNS